jgi:4-amino-4-deoxy-L-arabinose transferase-like glycosyltransferase
MARAGSRALGSERDARPAWWQDRFLLAVCAFTLAYRLLLLFTIDAHAHYDEAIIGVMARNILALGERPLFFYGQNYGGGGALEAYAAAGLFALFGESTLLLKLTPLLFSLAAIPLTYAVARRLHGLLAARLAILIFVTAPPTLEWSLAARGGYIETVFFSILLFWMALPLFEEGRPHPARAFAIGVAGGFAFYVFGLIAPALITLGLLMAMRRISWKSLGAAVLGVAAGAAPIVYDNIAHGFVNLRHLTTPGSAAGGPLDAAARFASKLAGLFTHDLAGFFTPWIDDFAPSASADSWIYVIAVVALVAVGAAASRHAWSGWLRRARHEDAERARYSEAPAFLQVASFLYLAIYALAYAASRFAGLTPRYLLALYPMLAIAAAAGAAHLIASAGRGSRALGWSLAGALIAIGGVRAALLPRPAELREYNVVSRGDSTPALIAFLREHDIRIIFASPPIKWRTLWEGRETILASSQFLPQEDEFRYPRYGREAAQQAASRGERAAFVTHAAFLYERVPATSEVPSILTSRELWEGALASRGITYARENVGDYLVYYGFSHNVPALLAARSMVFEARRMIESGRVGEAHALLTAARKLDPEDPEIARLLEGSPPR